MSENETEQNKNRSQLYTTRLHVVLYITQILFNATTTVYGLKHCKQTLGMMVNKIMYIEAKGRHVLGCTNTLPTS